MLQKRGVYCILYSSAILPACFDRGDRILDIKISDVSPQKWRWVWRVDLNWFGRGTLLAFNANRSKTRAYQPELHWYHWSFCFYVARIFIWTEFRWFPNALRVSNLVQRWPHTVLLVRTRHMLVVALLEFFWFHGGNAHAGPNLRLLTSFVTTISLRWRPVSTRLFRTKNLLLLSALTTLDQGCFFCPTRLLDL